MLVIWFNPQKATFYLKYYRFMNTFEIGFKNRLYHEIYQILIYDYNSDKLINCTSYLDYMIKRKSKPSLKKVIKDKLLSFINRL